MRLAGLQKMTLLDYPGEIACIIFTQGCNLRCPFCQNPDLVVPELFPETELLPEEEFFEFLDRRQGKLTGVVISGGEPTIHADLPRFMEKIHEKGYLVKLDTNGLNPEALAGILQRGLADYVAMDVKNTPEKYAMTVGLREACVGDLWKKAQESISLLMKSGIPYEFRTTVVEGLHTEEDILQMAKLLEGAGAWYLQQFLSDRELVADFAQDDLVMSTPSPSALERMRELAAPFVPAVKTRGI